MDYSEHFDEHFVGASEVEREEEEENREEGDENHVVVVAGCVGVVLLQQLGVLVDAEDVGLVVVLDALLAVESVQEDYLEGLVIVHVGRDVGGVSDSVVGVVEVADSESEVLQRSDAHEVVESAVSVDDLHHLVAVAFHPVFADFIQSILQ